MRTVYLDESAGGDGAHIISELETNTYAADKREFVQISRAVGVGFIVMGALGYIIKLSTSHHITQLFHDREAELRDHVQHGNVSEANVHLEDNSPFASPA